MAGSYWDKVTAQRVSRRRVLQGAGVAGAAAGAVWIVGCGGGSSSNNNTATSGGGGTPGATAGAGASQKYHTVNPSTGTPKSGGTYNVASAVDFDTFDPHISIAGGVAYFPRLYNAVLNRSAVDNSFQFDDLAESVEQPDDTTYVFKIRDGVKIAPNQLGVPERNLDGNDVKATFDRIKQLPQANAYAFVGPNIASVDASADGKTVTIKTPKPYGYFFFRIGSAINLIVPKELIAEADKMKAASAGAGPYVLNPGQYTEGQNATINRNPNYYLKDDKHNNAQLPYIDAYTIKIIAQQAALRTAFQSQQADQYSATDVNDAQSLQRGQSYVTVQDTTNTFVAFTMNPLNKPWDDDRVRKAANLALDRQVYVDRIYFGQAKVNGLVHWSLGDYALPPDELKKLQPHDPAQAKQLLSAAGVKDVKVMWPADSVIEQHSSHLPIFLQQMADAGFNIQKDPQAFATWLDNYTNKKYDASLALNQVYETAEFEMDFESKEGPAGSNIYSNGLGAIDPDIEKAILDSKAITDTKQQAAAVQQAQLMMYAKGAMFLPICTPLAFTLYQPYVMDIPAGIGSTGLFLNTLWLNK